MYSPQLSERRTVKLALTYHGLTASSTVTAHNIIGDLLVRSAGVLLSRVALRNWVLVSSYISAGGAVSHRESSGLLAHSDDSQ